MGLVITEAHSRPLGAGGRSGVCTWLKVSGKRPDLCPTLVPLGGRVWTVTGKGQASNPGCDS